MVVVCSARLWQKITFMIILVNIEITVIYGYWLWKNQGYFSITEILLELLLIFRIFIYTFSVLIFFLVKVSF